MKKLDSLTFITGNANKARVIAKHLDFPITHQKLDLVEIQSLDLEEVVRFKAKEAYEKVHKPVLVEDTSLTFLALGRLPGPYIKWFWEEMGGEKLCRVLDAFPDRSAMVDVSLGLYDGDELKIFTASSKGNIAMHPRGDDGFGWNPIFIYEGLEKTLAELTEEEREPYSARKKVVKDLEGYLSRLK